MKKFVVREKSMGDHIATTVSKTFPQPPQHTLTTHNTPEKKPPENISPFNEGGNFYKEDEP